MATADRIAATLPWSAASFAFFWMSWNTVMATAAMMAMIATTTMSSTRVKPLELRSCLNICLPPSPLGWGELLGQINIFWPALACNDSPESLSGTGAHRRIGPSGLEFAGSSSPGHLHRNPRPTPQVQFRGTPDKPLSAQWAGWRNWANEWRGHDYPLPVPLWGKGRVYLT